jgi:hypothetical protein
MSTIKIKDLPENVALDRQAMLAISGGSRYGGRPGLPTTTVRIADVPPGLPGYISPIGGQPAGSKPRK